MELSVFKLHPQNVKPLLHKQIILSNNLKLGEINKLDSKINNTDSKYSLDTDNYGVLIIKKNQIINPLWIILNKLHFTKQACFIIGVMKSGNATFP